jgi:hypothetical protein
LIVYLVFTRKVYITHVTHTHIHTHCLSLSLSLSLSFKHIHTHTHTHTPTEKVTAKRAREGTEWEFLADSSDEESAGGRLFMDANAVAKGIQREHNFTKLSDGSFANLHPVIIQNPGLMTFLPERLWPAHCKCNCGESGSERHNDIPMPVSYVAEASAERVECVWLCVLMWCLYLCVCVSLFLSSLSIFIVVSTSLHCFDMLCSSIVNSLYVCTTGAT